jgi:hypothetical protein
MKSSRGEASSIPLAFFERNLRSVDWMMVVIPHRSHLGSIILGDVHRPEVPVGAGFYVTASATTMMVMRDGVVVSRSC